MTRPFLHKCACAPAFLGILAVFILIRSASLDRSYKEYVTGKAAQISSSFDSFFAKNEFSKDTIQSHMKETPSRYKDLALLAISGEDGRVILWDPIYPDTGNLDTYNAIVNDIDSGKFPASAKISVAEQYYKSRKFYIIPVHGEKSILTLVFPRSLPVSFILRFILEIIAVGCITAAFAGIVYLTLQKRLVPVSAKSRKQPKEKAPKQESRAAKKTAPRLEPFLLESFSAIAGATGAETLTLTALNAKTGKPESVLVSDGDRIIRTKVKGETADTRAQILEELRHGSHILRDRSRKVLIPVIAHGALSAVVSVSRGKKFTGKDIAQIKHAMSGIDGCF